MLVKRYKFIPPVPMRLLPDFVCLFCILVTTLNCKMFTIRTEKRNIFNRISVNPLALSVYQQNKQTILLKHLTTKFI